MITVKATDASKKHNKALREFHRVVNEGEIFRVSEERYNYLHHANQFGLTFVEKFDPSINIHRDEKITIHRDEKEVKAYSGQKIVTPMETIYLPDYKEVGEPEIYMIEPGKDPVLVDENLVPIKVKKNTKADKKDKPTKKPKTKSKKTN